MIVRFILIFFFGIVFFINARGQDSVVYTDNLTSIILYSDGRFVQKLECDICLPDTISYGKYVKYSNVFYLISDPYIDDYRLPSSTIEQIVPNLYDSIIIDINSPFTKNPNLFPNILQYFYQVTLFYDIKDTFLNNTEIVNAKNGESKPQICYTNPIRISKLPHIPIKQIDIKIYPTLPNTWWAFLLCSFTLEDKYSNDIQLSIPKFTNRYIFYRRYNKKKALIIDDECIMIDNNIYCKEYNSYRPLPSKHVRKIPKAFLWWKVKNPYE